MKDRTKWWFRVLAVAVVCCCVGTRSAAAQFRRPFSPEVINVFLPAPRELRLQISRARKALDEQRYGDAVFELGELLVAPEAEDYFIGPVGEAGTQTSLKAEAQRLIGSMPRKGRQAYELQFGAKARALLEEALERGDSQQLTDVTRMYFHTKAGYQAALLLGRYHLDRGRPLAGALCLKRLLDTGNADDFDPELSILLSTCWLYANMPDKAVETLVRLQDRMPAASLRVGDSRVKLFSDSSDALPWLTQLTGARKALGSVEKDQWVMFRGSPGRNARSAGGVPSVYLRWRVPTANDPNDEQEVKQLSKQYVDRGLPALPALHPLAVGDYVLTRTPHNLVAVDFRTGKRVWEFPWDESSYQRAAGDGDRWGSPNATSSRRNDLNQRLYEDAPYGQISSDGQSVFLLHDLGIAAPSRPNVRMLRGGRPQPDPTRPKSFNQLVALSLKREGALRWKVGGSSGEDEERLAGAFFLGAPLPLLGQLYVLAEVNSEIRLIVLDARTGKLEWWQQLAHVSEINPIQHDIVRRLSGATPSFADGVLVCPTSAGAVVAVDLSTRSLLWGYQYRQTSFDPTLMRFGRTYPTQQSQIGSRWTDSTVTIADGRVLVSPLESDELHCLDLLTGKPMWPEPKKRNDSLYVACVHNGKVVLVGKKSVAALSLADGEPAWSQSVVIGALPSGRGFYSHDDYFLPTTDSKLLKIDLEAGTVVQQVETENVLGNLICYRDEIISQNVDWVVTLYQKDPLQANVDQRLRANPDDVWALTRSGELLLQDGKQTEALAALRRAYGIDSSDDATRSLLVRTLLEALRNDFAANRAVATEIDDLIDQPQQRAEYLRLMAAGLHEAGEIELAFDTYLDLAGLREDAFGEESTSRTAMEQVERQLNIRRDRWVQARLADLIAAAEVHQASRMEKAIQDRFEAARTTNRLHLLSQFIDYFSAHPLADKARLLLAAKQADMGELLAAEVLLSRAMNSTDKTLAAQATARMARLFEQAQQYPQAARFYHKLNEKWPSVVCLDGKTGRQLFEVAAANGEWGRLLKQPLRWASGHTEVDEVDEPNITSDYQRIYPIAIRHSTGALPAGTSVALHQGRDVVVSDGRGNVLCRVLLDQPDTRRAVVSSNTLMHAKINGHLLILSLGYEVVAIDILRATNNGSEAILWRHSLIDTMPTAPGSRTIQRIQSKSVGNPWGGNMVIPIDAFGRRVGEIGPIGPHGVAFLKQTELLCVDTLTGTPLWVRDGLPAGSELFGDDERLYVIAPGSNQVLVYRAADGRSLPSRSIDGTESRWATLGSRTLVWSQQDDTINLVLRDIWTETELWSRQYPLGSKGTLVDSSTVAIMQTNGQLEILSLDGSRPRIEAALEEEDALSGIFVLKSSDQYILATNNSNTRTTANFSVNSAPGGPHSPMINGRIYAIDRKTGSLQWSGPARVAQFGLPLDQPTEVPVLVLLRNMTSTSRTPATRTRASVLCIDRRDGRVILAKDDIPSVTQAYRVVGKPDEQSVLLMLNGFTYRIKFTDRPTPPAPPAQAVQTSMGPATIAARAAVDLVDPRQDPFGPRAAKLPNAARTAQQVRRMLQQQRTRQLAENQRQR